MSREYEIDSNSIDNHPINKAGKKMLESSLFSCISAIIPALGVLLSVAKSGMEVFNEQKYKDGIYKRLQALERELEKLMPLIKLMQNTNDEQENSEVYSLLVTIFENALKTAYTERIKYFVKVSRYYVEDRNYYYGCQNEVVRIIAELSGGEIALLQEAYQAEVEKSTIKADPNYKTGLIADSEEKTTLAAPNSEEEVRRIGIALLMGKALLGITQGRRLKGTSISSEQSYTITALGKKVYETMEKESQKVESDVHEKSEPYGYALVDSQGLKNK